MSPIYVHSTIQRRQSSSVFLATWYMRRRYLTLAMRVSHRISPAATDYANRSFLSTLLLSLEICAAHLFFKYAILAEWSRGFMSTWLNARSRKTAAELAYRRTVILLLVNLIRLRIVRGEDAWEPVSNSLSWFNWITVLIKLFDEITEGTEVEPKQGNILSFIQRGVLLVCKQSLKLIKK